MLGSASYDARVRARLLLLGLTVVLLMGGCRVLRRLGVGEDGEPAAADANAGGTAPDSAAAADAAAQPWVKRPPEPADYLALAESILDGIAALETEYLPMTGFTLPVNRDPDGVDFAATHDAEGLHLEVYIWMGKWRGEGDVLPRKFGDLSVAVRADGPQAHAVRMAILEQLDRHWDWFWKTYDLRGA